MEESFYYRELVDMAILAGQIMISAGAETHRVEDTISRILQTTGFSQADAFVLPTGITVTLSDEKKETLSVTRRIMPGSNNLSRIYLVNNVSRDFCSGKITLDEAKARLEKIKNEHIYGRFVKIIGVMLTMGMFSLLFGGSLLDAAVALVAGFAMALENYYLRKFIGMDFLCDALCAATITVVSLLFVYGAMKSGTELHLQYIIVGGIMPLVPGVAITNAVRDVLKGDFISACARMVEAFMIAAAVAVGVGAGIFFGRQVGFAPEAIGFITNITRSGFVGYAVGFLAAAGSIIGFSFILEVPKKFVFASAITAAFGWTAYLLGFYNGMGDVWASFLGAMLAELLSYIFARVLKAPETIFLICGIIPMVPGAGIYRAVYYLISGDPLAASALTSTLMIAGAIALGLITMYTVLDMLHKGIMKARKK
ncbi:MAG: threonine/serine exporter family protein [Eubacteriales bacterium]|nr:threonine/serine exporter family protein [Eubacteriales bacterium]